MPVNKAFFILVFFQLFLGCVAHDDNPCPRYEEEMAMKDYGSKYFQSSNSSLPPFNHPFNSVFVSNNSDSIHFNCSKLRYDIKSVQLNQRLKNSNCTIYKFYDIGRYELEEISYTGNSPVAFKFVLQRTWNFKDITDSLSFSKAPEIYKLTWNNNVSLNVALDRYADTLGQKYHEKFNANGKMVDSVFEFYVPIVDINYIELQGVYYQKRKGLIGFFLTQKVQQWWLD